MLAVNIEPVVRRRLSADEFQRMGAAGVFAPDERVELVDGEVIEMPPIGFEHADVTNGFTNTFASATGKARLQVQGPLRLDADNEVYPDFCLLRLPHDRYRQRLPEPADVLLLVEVALSSLRYDRHVKLPLYARAGIVEVWLVDVERKRVQRYCEPGDGEWLRSEVLNGRVAPIALPDCAIDLGELF